MSERISCAVCGEATVTPFFRLEDVPISCNHLCSSRSLALSEPRAAICLGFCHDCGHVFNIEYDPTELKYRSGYEASLRGSQRFREYEDALVDALLERYRLRGRRIVELGCGHGEFLRALCGRGGNAGIGFDPSYSGEEESASESPDIVIHPEVYESLKEELNAEFICSRQTLEHVPEPREFLRNIRNATKSVGIPVFFEVPSGLYILRDGDIWDIIYEHRSYFTPTSLARVFRETGYESVEVADAFGGQFLTVHARTGAPNRDRCPTATPDLDYLVGSFEQRCQNRLKDWACKLLKLESEGRKIVVWGAGAKATTFLNLLRPVNVDYVVDVNPRKQWKYIVGTGQRIVPPEFLREYPPDEVVCMNPNYLDEIAHVVSAFGLQISLVPA
jgi:SAM-dependent methyltransferase